MHRHTQKQRHEDTHETGYLIKKCITVITKTSYYYGVLLKFPFSQFVCIVCYYKSVLLLQLVIIRYFKCVITAECCCQVPLL